jgi:hypothetical protein
MNRINLFCTNAIRHSAPAFDSSARAKNNFDNNASILVFTGLLIICSFAVGCSNDKSKPQISSSQNPSTQSTAPAPIAPAPTMPETQATAKPVQKKVVRHASTTVKYVDKDSGVSFRYPRKYVLKTGDAADELVSSNLAVMDFAQPGGVVTAAVAIPEGAYPKSDLVSAMFDVSVNKSLTEEQCSEFSAPQPDSATQGNTPASTAAPTSKLILGDMELTSAETLGSAGSRKEESKYYHVFENGACYEFALKVASTGVDPDEGGKPVDRDEVLKKLETILATVKISPLETEKQTASVPVPAPTTPAQTTPAQ